MRYAPRAPRRFTWARRLAVIGLVLLLAAIVAIAGWRWSQSQYYVANEGDDVVIYQGIEADVPGINTHHVEDFGRDYAETLKHWAQNLDENLEEANRLAGPERIRVWRLYLRAARNGFESGFTNIYQARCSKA